MSIKIKALKALGINCVLKMEFAKFVVGKGLIYWMSGNKERDDDVMYTHTSHDSLQFVCLPTRL